MNDFDVRDTILYPITYDNLVLMAQNLNPARGITLRQELKNLLREKVEEALELFDEHEEDIYAAAFPDEEEPEENPLGEEKTAQLAKEIYDFLLKHEMWMDISIYFNGICWSTSNRGINEFRYNGEPFVFPANPKDYFDYVGPILSMSFEGAFYEVMNGYLGSYGYKFEEEFRAMLSKYGCYYELGNEWNLSVCQI